jgi:hypothetical protein
LNPLPKIFIVFLLGLLTACASTSTPSTPRVDIVVESNLILDRLENSCFNLGKCRTSEKVIIDSCERDTHSSPLSGSGFKKFKQVVGQRYAVSQEVSYRGVEEFSGDIVTEFLIGNGVYKLTIDRSTRIIERTLCDDYKSNVYYEFREIDPFSGRSWDTKEKDITGTPSTADTARIEEGIRQLLFRSSANKREYQNKINRRDAVIAKRNYERNQNRAKLDKAIMGKLNDAKNNANNINTNSTTYGSPYTSSKPIVGSSVTQSSSSGQDWSTYICDAYYDHINNNDTLSPTALTAVHRGSSPQHAAKGWLNGCKISEKSGARLNCRIDVRTCKKQN